MPGTCDKSTPASLALRLTAGEARGLVPDEVIGAGAGEETGAGFGSGALATGSGALTGSGAGSGSGSGSELPEPSTSKTINSAPTGIISPGFPVVDTTLPFTVEGIDTVALSVISSTKGSSSFTVSPGFTFHFTISPSTTPSPTSGSLNTCLPILVLHYLLHRLYNPFLTREIMPFK